VNPARRALSRVSRGVGASQVRDLRDRVERLEGDLVEHRELQRLLADEVSGLERMLRAVTRGDGGTAR
jgi:hypothetical protein